MAFVLEYKMKKGYTPTKETLKATDEGMRGMQALLVEVCRVVHPTLTPVMWLVTRFVHRTITDESIKYSFWLMPKEK